MNETTARELVMEAGNRLAKAGLIARTWGNVSCRISGSQFAVTPSGRAYDAMAADDIVTVEIADLSYKGSNKPSSETGIHAAVYRMRPEINFVIHTHQMNASVISALHPRKLKGFICAAYGLPGSARLRRGVIDVLGKSDCRGIIMAHHGALCLGTDMEDAFANALELEDRCREYIELLTGASSYSHADAFEYRSDRAVPKMRTKEQDETDASHIFGQASETTIFKRIYQARPDISHIIFAADPDILLSSAEEKPLKPLVDDMAQIIGISLKIADWNPDTPDKSSRAIVSALDGRHAVLLRGRGILCCGANEKDAEAVLMIAKKGCRAYNTAKATGVIKPINPIECRLMRWNYLKHYSKQAYQK